MNLVLASEHPFGVRFFERTQTAVGLDVGLNRDTTRRLACVGWQPSSELLYCRPDGREPQLSVLLIGWRFGRNVDPQAVVEAEEVPPLEVPAAEQDRNYKAFWVRYGCVERLLHSRARYSHITLVRRQPHELRLITTNAKSSVPRTIRALKCDAAK